jgi:hypothetical protein
LMNNDDRGPAEIGYRAMTRLAGVIPDQAWQLVFSDKKELTA